MSPIRATVIVPPRRWEAADAATICDAHYTHCGTKRARGHSQETGLQLYRGRAKRAVTVRFDRDS